MNPTSPILYVLDVGHGNSAVLKSPAGVVVIDAGPKNALYLFLKQLQVSVIDLLLVTHADADHIAETQTLIASGEFTIRKLRLNTDSSKDTKIWDDILYAVNEHARHGLLDFDIGLTTAFDYQLGDVHLEIVSPEPYLAAKGPGSTDHAGRPITTNTSCAVVRISRNNGDHVLLSSDVDLVGLKNMIDSKRDATARIAVFAHHGGRPGRSDPSTFAQLFCQAVSPEILLFSIGRGRFDNPNPAVISALRRVAPNVRIACTQLSEHCASVLPRNPPGHLHPTFAQGRFGGACCAGTIHIILEDEGAIVYPDHADHAAFIAASAPTALCI